MFFNLFVQIGALDSEQLGGVADAIIAIFEIEFGMVLFKQKKMPRVKNLTW